MCDFARSLATGDSGGRFMGGLRGGRGGGGGGGFEDNESFEAMDDARSLSDGCELFLGGGGGGGDESVGCCVVASIFLLLAMSYAAPRDAAVRASALLPQRLLGKSGLRHRAHTQCSGRRPLRPMCLSGPWTPPRDFFFQQLASVGKILARFCSSRCVSVPRPNGCPAAVGLA